MSAEMVAYADDLESSKLQLRISKAFLSSAWINDDLRLDISKQILDRIAQKKPLTVDDVPLLHTISQSLLDKLKVELHNPYLMHHSLFFVVDFEDVSFSHEVCTKCCAITGLAKCEDLFAANAHASAMYVVASGSLVYEEAVSKASGSLVYEEAVSNDNFTKVHTSQLLSESALWVLWRHIGTVHAQSASLCLQLNTEKFSAFIPSHQMMFQIVAEYAQKFHQRLMNRGEKTFTDLEAHDVCYREVVFFSVNCGNPFVTF